MWRIRKFSNSVTHTLQGRVQTGKIVMTLLIKVKLLSIILYRADLTISFHLDRYKRWPGYWVSREAFLF